MKRNYETFIEPSCFKNVYGEQIYSKTFIKNIKYAIDAILDCKSPPSPAELKRIAKYIASLMISAYIDGEHAEEKKQKQKRMHLTDQLFQLRKEKSENGAAAYTLKVLKRYYNNAQNKGELK